MDRTSTLDALRNLCQSIPEWCTRLDTLNGQIASRQKELAQLEQRPPTRSLKHKGSTESLRPTDGNQNYFFNPEVDETCASPFDSPGSAQDAFATSQGPIPFTPTRPSGVFTPPPSTEYTCSHPNPSPDALNRQSSHPTPPPQPRIRPTILRKRKTDSLASGDSATPKYRTRSMIIVYYDSAVQTAFEDLVKFVSLSRNAMRKGKMAVKMAEMRRAAELDIDSDEDQDDDELTEILAARSPGLLLAASRNVNGGVDRSKLSGNGPSLIDACDVSTDSSLPRLRFVSTRQMGPSRDYVNTKETGLGLSRAYTRAGLSAGSDTFENLDKGLEWCQSQCEHAAHQFLRDGECSQEINNIKQKLAEVREGAEKEMETLKIGDTAPLSARISRLGTPDNVRSRALRPPSMRREITPQRSIEAAENMEVDDEGVDDMEPPKLMFKRSGDVRRY